MHEPLDGARADLEPPRNVPVSQAFPDQTNDLLLAFSDRHCLHRFRGPDWSPSVGGCWRGDETLVDSTKVLRICSSGGIARWDERGANASGVTWKGLVRSHPIEADSEEGHQHERKRRSPDACAAP